MIQLRRLLTTPPAAGLCFLWVYYREDPKFYAQGSAVLILLSMLVIKTWKPFYSGTHDFRAEELESRAKLVQAEEVERDLRDPKEMRKLATKLATLPMTNFGGATENYEIEFTRAEKVHTLIFQVPTTVPEATVSNARVMFREPEKPEMQSGGGYDDALGFEPGEYDAHKADPAQHLEMMCLFSLLCLNVTGYVAFVRSEATNQPLEGTEGQAVAIAALCCLGGPLVTLSKLGIFDKVVKKLEVQHMKSLDAAAERSDGAGEQGRAARAAGRQVEA